MSPYSGDPGLGSETDGGVLLLLALVLLLGMGMYHYKLVYGGQRNKYWESLSADDIRIVSFGSSKWVLALFRISALGYCSAMWALYLIAGNCCGELRYYSVWSFMMMSLFFLLGTLVSLTESNPNKRLTSLDRVFVVLYEIIFPTIFITFFIFWTYIKENKEYSFPNAKNETWNIVFILTNPAIMLMEFFLNRMLLVSRRWFYLTYWSLGYVVFIILTEFIVGNDYHVYSKRKFLELKGSSVLTILQLLLLHFVFHYACCILGSIKQSFWLTPLPRDIADGEEHLLSS